MKVAQSCSTLCDPTDYPVCGTLQARILEWVAFPFSRGSSQPRVEPRSPALQVDSLPAEPPGKPKNLGVGTLSLLHGIFLTQKSNWGLLCCRQILYQLSYEGPEKSDRKVICPQPSQQTMVEQAAGKGYELLISQEERKVKRGLCAVGIPKPHGELGSSPIRLQVWGKSGLPRWR